MLVLTACQLRLSADDFTAHRRLLTAHSYEQPPGSFTLDRAIRPLRRVLSLSLGSCFVWVLILSGVGYSFSSAVIRLIGDFRHLGKILLVIVLAGVAVVYLIKRTWVSKKVEESSARTLAGDRTRRDRGLERIEGRDY